MPPFWPLAVFFVFSSLAFGCMEGWAIATCEVILFLGAAAVGWNDREFWQWPRRLWLPALLVAVLVAVGLLQLVPLPVSWWRAAKAERVAIYDEGAKAEALLHTDAYRRDPFGPDADKPLPPENWTPLTPKAPAWIPATFTPLATTRALVALAAGFALILLLEHLGRKGKDQLRRLALLVGCLGLLVAAIALVQYSEQRTTILGLRESPYAQQAFGPFVNPNHGEAFVNLAFPLLYYLIWRKSLRERHRANRWGLRALIVGLLGLHATLLVVSHSRAAFLALALYPLAYLGHKAFKGSKVAIAATTLYMLALVGGAAFAWSVGVLSDDGRLRLDANVPASYFILGNGLASFDQRWPSVITDLPLLAQTHNTHLENEYLQTFFEGGLFPAVLACIGGLWALGLVLKNLALRHAAFWLAPALAAETIHAFVDFIGHVFPLVGGILLLWLFLSMNHDEEPSEARTLRGPTLRPLIAYAVCALALVALALHLPGFNDSPSLTEDLFAQGAFRPLLKAEAALNGATPPSALALFQVAALRAQRSNQGPVFERVRFRLMNAGSALIRKDYQQGWTVLSTACLWARSFTRSAAETESWVVEHVGAPPSFGYPLMAEGGRRTIWGQGPEKGALWLYRHFNPNHSLARLPGSLGNQTVAQLPASGDAAYAFPLALWFSKSSLPQVVSVVPRAGYGGTWYLGANQRVNWSEPQAGTSARWVLPGEDLWAIDRLVAVGDDPPPPFQAVLIHEYRALN